MIKATFSETQPQIRTFHISETLIQYQLCLHEEVIEPTEEDPNVSYVYDFNEFTESTTILTEEDVKQDPEKYLDYVPKAHEEVPENKQSLIEAEINALKERQDIADMALQELILSQLGGE